MSDDTIRFTAIKGIGKRTDARLHEAGVDTWHSLAEVLTALSTVKEVSSERLRAMGEQASRRASRTRAGADAPDVERAHRFVVEITLDTSGTALRSSVTDVRAECEQHWSGWEPTSVIAFVEGAAGVTVRDTASAAPALVAVASPVPTLDLGRVIGGRRRSVEVVVGLDGSGDRATHCTGSLAVRRLGDASAQVVARSSAATTGPELTLRFPDVEIPAGVHHLALQLDIRGRSAGLMPELRDLCVA
jgi:hypothetical protein